MKTLLPLALASSAAAQTTIHVPADHPTIQQAIQAAAGGDTVLVAPGEYVEQIDFLGKEVRLISSGGAAVTRIDSKGAGAWNEHPVHAVVRMISGEGPGARIQGFTITGGRSSSSPVPDGSGVWCAGLSPTIADCVIEQNHGGSGVFGDARIEGCVIRANDALPYDPGGGVRGRATITGCVIEGNASGDRGGGVYATGPCTITDTVIRGNFSGDAFDGYSGGGVFGPATLVRCEVTFNYAGHHESGGPPDTVGAGVDGASALIQCTIAHNVAYDPPPGGVDDPSGGVKSVGAIQGSILYGNAPRDVAHGSTPAISYSIVGSGWSGPGVFSADPLFVAPASGGDYHLQPGSPAIDAGDPLGAADPDGTIADLGAYAFPQFTASAVVRNGTGVNPLCYTSGLPLMGSTWTAQVDATGFGISTPLVLVAGTLAPLAPIPTAFGELLIDPGSPQVLALSAGPTGGVASFAVPIPLDPHLHGLVVSTQAVGAGSSIELANAIDLSLGTL